MIVIATVAAKTAGNTSTYTTNDTLAKKLGPPFLIKVNEETLEISQDFTREEWFWIIEEECRINKD